MSKAWSCCLLIVDFGMGRGDGPLSASFQTLLLDPVPGVVIHVKGFMDYAKYLKRSIFW